MAAVAGRMRSDGDRIAMLMTGGPGRVSDPGVLHAPVPPESTAAVAQFLARWTPDLLLWIGGDLRPALLSEADRLALPRILVDAEASRLGPRHGWMGGSRNALLRGFSRALAVDADSAQRLRRAGLEDRQIEIAGRLQETTLPLPCDDGERSVLTAELASRPVWFAAQATADEVPLIVTAHIRASRRAHRLLLVIMPTPDVDSIGLAEKLFQQDYAVALRSEGHEITEATEIVIADSAGELGLWHRLSPISFIGGTLRGGNGADPFQAATLGSAVLHGPLTGLWHDHYLRLGRAGAARPVQTGDDLGAAVESLLAPDRTAAMVHAGWDVASAGAEVTNRLIDLIRDGLEGAL